ncbi:MAG: two-component sensor histidine kinase [Sphingobacteriales bacterium]|nr:two-component sensor histidine kinase [Sphingobacteriales bacterium]
MDVIAKNGIGYYLQDQESYGSYTMLKEEYISLEPVSVKNRLDTIETAMRLVEQDTLTYRLLSNTFKIGKQNYLLEIGKTTSAINQYNRPLQRIALYVLISLILVTMLIDLLYTRILIKPLGQIIKTKLLNPQFPFIHHSKKVKTTTKDFNYLDNSLILLMDQINVAFEKEREFTANASHELMTPISILQNKMEMLMADADENETLQQKLIEMMKTLGRLKKIVNSLLLISRIENDQFVKSDTLHPKELVEEVMEEISHRLEEKSISFRMNISKSVTLINLNRDLVFQLFYNLINNAIKYNKEQGSITIKEKFKQGSLYCILIEDTGIGIPSEELNTIFNRFKKANLSESGGFGLGLSIAKSIANYHGISLKVESKVNEGTTFSIVFPKEMLADK